MTWKNFIALPAIAPRRRLIATALVHGLSLTVRFTSAVGEEPEVPVQALLNDRAQIISMSSSSRPVPAYLRWPRASGGCRAACESSMTMLPASNCAIHR
ncbi:hypothetical protein [Afipia sp. GAS231]|uniref:hypothetical protein n=1 Tax=Afipia sp. GAS231 TaxID=1882747 RepID=UPI00087D7A71|nr:hypothetical protein [Afipia sp. GAS231]SDN12202.1 hypothetical protein SAMN05444050_0730 [Afipia sp. GAS231]